MNAELEQIKQKINTLKAENAAMHRENARVQARNAAMQAQFQQAQSRCICVQRRLRVQAGIAFSALMAAALFSPASRTAIAQGYGVTLATLNTRLLAAESKTQYMSADTTARSTTFSGCNLIVNDGGGAGGIVTNAGGQGVGNLIIGYNALRGDGTDIRAGSHNLILGDLSNYSSYGGIAAGYSSAISAPYACVTGGFFNTASGYYASVSGGDGNTANGYSSSVSGGDHNTASGNYASVSGGSSITAGGEYAWAAGSYHTP